MKNVLIVTSTRADWGLLKNLAKRLKNICNLAIVATGTHFSEEFGMTYKEIENDGFQIDEKIFTLSNEGSSLGVNKTMANTIDAFAEYFARKNFDLLIILGDRFEILGVCYVAVNQRIPIAHLHGGETTQGVADEYFRHSITKMSVLHFVSTNTYRNRVIQLGENPDNVFNVGAIGVENIISLEPLTRDELSKRINFDLSSPYAVITFHPVSLENSTATYQLSELLSAIDSIGLRCIITKANADEGGRIINAMLDNWAKDRKDILLTASLGNFLYLSAVKYSEFVLGNSSSGILEAPSLNVPTINIGDRQKGRIQAKSIINCEPTQADIIRACEEARAESFKNIARTCENPYGNGDTSNKIVEILQKKWNSLNLKKVFYDLSPN